MVDLTGHVHIVGIGGAGMSGIARILTARGAVVSGSDAKESRRLVALRALGIDARVGHDGANVEGADVVVISTAIKAANPEVVGARERGIPVVSRAVALAAVMAGSRGVAVAGTHGKTTTTSMLTIAAQHCGADPSFAIGSELNDSGANAHQGAGDLFIAEADESDGSFLRLPAVAGIVTNVEPDHLDHWGTFEAIEAGFVEFATGIGAAGGFVVACADDPGSARLAQSSRDLGVDVRTYGLDPAADYVLSEVQTSASGSRAVVSHGGAVLGRLNLQVHGTHNVLNAAAALVAAIGLGLPAADVLEGLSLFSGTRRRFDFKGEVAGVRVFDDYAHHPTEIAATLTAAMNGGHERVIAVFQPHLFSRTRYLQREFGRALTLADEAIVTEIFPSREEPEPGVSGKLIVDAYLAERPGGPVSFLPRLSDVVARLAPRVRSGDLVLTLGAGDVFHAGEELLATLAGQGEGTSGAE
jgi:UDP-N-acetylmuramate--alanine ligase